ncbi:MAG: formate dehydrogenase accessory sulfurtransferase FdhD [Rhodobacteraceae bacterium]|nr:formate dehydrogenase accessory sulfurtransferase FdhD [Paracoccaceae bacterium]
MAESKWNRNYLICPDPKNPELTRSVKGLSHEGLPEEIKVVEEKPLTIFLNSTEIVTVMTIGDYPEYLALGFLFNQGMLRSYHSVERVDYDQDLQTVVVRTTETTNFEVKLQKKTRTSGCAVGTVFGDQMELIEGLQLPFLKVKTSWLYHLAKSINLTPSLYLEAGAIHGTVLCKEDQTLVYMEDVGRHNAVDKINGWMKSKDIQPEDKLIYTTGRLTSEMILKTALMGIPVLVSRSGFTAWGVEIARKVNLTLIGRMRGKRFICLAGEERLERNILPDEIGDEARKHQRKGAKAD